MSTTTSPLQNTESVTSGTLQIFYWNELNTPSLYALSAATVGLKLAQQQHRWQGIRPQGEGAKIEAVIIASGSSLHESIQQAMAEAQERWPDAKNWEIIGAESNKWTGAQTYAQFTWPLRNAQ